MLTNLSQILISLAIIINALGQNANICHLTNCETCSPLNPFICINCDSGYTRDLETGCKNSSSLIPSFQIENCLTLNQDSCLQCIPDYELFNNRCNPICQENCSCFYPGECLISLTKEFRNLVSCDTARCNSCCSGDTGYCCTCDMYYCRVCEVSSICDECGLGYGFNGANCTQCMDTNCYNCSTNDADCIICNPGYKLDGNAGCILDCDDPKCTSCTNQTTCETCITGYYLSGSTCVQCDTNCSDCTSTNTCTQCEFGNGFLNSACRACNDTYCYNCNDDYLNCILCIDGYELIEDCISVCLHDSHCKECNISQGCELCDPGFYVHENGYCTLCGLLNCNECYNTDYCEACKDGYGFSNNSCLACSDNCYNCSNDYKFCDLCYDGYSLNDLGECSVSSSSSIFSNQNIIIIASVGSGVVLIASVILLCWIRKRLARKRLIQNLNTSRPNEMLQIINPNPTIPPAQNITTPIPPANPFRQKPTMFFEGMDRSQRIEADFQSEGHISLKKQPTIYFEKTTRKKEFDNSANTDYMMGSNIAFVTLDERNMYLDQSTCSICNQAFSSDLVTRALQCDHAFHEDCLRESFKTLDEVRCHNCGRPA